MPGFKTFTVGEVLTAADVNDYLMEQAVIQCTSGTRPGSPHEGMVIFETDTDGFFYYTGAAWRILNDHRWVRKTASEDVTSSTSLQNDNHLVVTLPASSYFRFNAHLFYDAPTAAGITIGWTLPSGASMVYAAMGPTTSAAGYDDDQTGSFDGTQTPSFGAHGVGTYSSILLQGLIAITTGGTVQLRWAQRVSNATRTRMFALSYLDFVRKE